jgi:hypothetical protein
VDELRRVIGHPLCGGRRFEPPSDEAAEDLKGSLLLLGGEGCPEGVQRPAEGRFGWGGALRRGRPGMVILLVS